MDVHGPYYQCESDWCKQLIEGNVDYYSDGHLPLGLPVLSSGVWTIVVSEIMSGKRVNQPVATEGKL